MRSLVHAGTPLSTVAETLVKNIGQLHYRKDGEQVCFLFAVIQGVLILILTGLRASTSRLCMSIGWSVKKMSKM